MPNYCDNSATITNADSSKIDELEKVLLSEEGELFQAIRARPLEEDDNSYDWNCQNWGTKWGASLIDFDRQDENTIWVSFESAWSPPIALYEYMSNNGWEVDAIYHEPGMEYAGNFIDGVDNCYEYDITEEDTWKPIPMDIQDFADFEGLYESWKESEDS